MVYKIFSRIWLQVFRLANKAQLILKLSFFVSILVLALVFLRKCNHGLQNFLTLVINKSVSKATQKNGYKFERKYQCQYSHGNQ